MLSATLFGAMALLAAQVQPAVNGTVLGLNGPQAAAAVRVYPRQDRAQCPISAITDANGRFRIILPSFATYIVEATDSSSRYGSVVVRPTELLPDIVVTITLQPRAAVGHEVVAVTGNRPCNTCETIDYTPALPISRSYPPTLVLPPSPLH